MDTVTADRIALLRAGYIPTPCDGKKPILRGWQERLQINDADIELWREERPAAQNTGALTRNNPTFDIDVLDAALADRIEAFIRQCARDGEVLVRYGLRPKRAIPFRLAGEPFRKLRTPIFIDANGNENKVEVLSDGQQFVVAGIHPDTSQPYTWQPQALQTIASEKLPSINECEASILIERITAMFRQTGWKEKGFDRPKTISERAAANVTPSIDRGPTNLDDIRDALRAIPANDREIWLRVGFALEHELGDQGRAMWDEWSKSCKAKFNKPDQDKNWYSFGRGNGITIGTLFHYAKQYGWQRPRKDRPDIHVGEQNTKPGHNNPPPENDIAENYVCLGEAPPKPPEELIKGLIPKEGVAVTGGQSGGGKTFVKTLKSVCLATGTPYFRHKIVEHVGTVFVAAEGRPLLPNRFGATLAKLEIIQKLPIMWPKRMPDFSSLDGLKRLISELKEIDRRYRGDFGTRLGQVVIDTVAASFNMKDEDDNSEATRVCNVMRSIGEETGALMAPVHHYGKNPESGLRGASAWKGSADVIEGVLADIDPLSGRVSNRELVCAKARDGEQGPISPFDLEFVALGLNDDNEIYGSCCVVPTQRESRLDKGPAPSKSQRTIIDAINEALDNCGKVITPRAGMPQLRAVKVSDVRTEFDRRYVVADTDAAKVADAKRKAFRRALDYLSPAKFGAGSAEGTDWIWKITSENSSRKSTKS
jgi:hypothetical protein